MHKRRPPPHCTAALPQRKKRTHVRDDQDPAKKGQPKSFVFRRGRHGVSGGEGCGAWWGARACVSGVGGGAQRWGGGGSNAGGLWRTAALQPPLPRSLATPPEPHSLFPPGPACSACCACCAGHFEGAGEGSAQAHVPQHRHAAQGARVGRQARGGGAAGRLPGQAAAGLGWGVSTSKRANAPPYWAFTAMGRQAAAAHCNPPPPPRGREVRTALLRSSYLHQYISHPMLPFSHTPLRRSRGATC